MYPRAAEPGDNGLEAGRASDHSTRPIADQQNRKEVRRRTFLVLGPLTVLLVLWLWLFYAEGAFKGGPNGKTFGANFAAYYSGAQLMQNGANPYDQHFLYRAERALMNRDHLPIVSMKASVRVGSPPLFVWALQPLLKLPYQTAAVLWCGLLYALAVVGFLGSIYFLGWRARWLPLLLFLLMPQVVLAAFYGNVVGLVFPAFGLALALIKRHPFVSGMLLSAGILKPHVAFPIALLIALFVPASRRPLAAGFGTAMAGILGLTGLLTGLGSLHDWFTALTQFSAYSTQTPGVASLAGLYVRTASTHVRLILEGLSLGGAAIVTLYFFWKYRHESKIPVIAVGWLWFVWFLVEPYAHFYDEILLTVPVLALLGMNGYRVIWKMPGFSLYLMFACLFLISWAPGNVQLLGLPLAVVAACLMRASMDTRYRLA